VTEASALPGQPVLLTPAPTRVVGILNVTPDSFSDGGLFVDVETAVAHGLKLAAEGAALVDVGGESTRPGAIRVDAATELARVLPAARILRVDGQDLFWWGVRTPAAVARLTQVLDDTAPTR